MTDWPPVSDIVLGDTLKSEVRIMLQQLLVLDSVLDDEGARTWAESAGFILFGSDSRD